MELNEAYTQFDEQGYCVLERLIDPATCESLDAKGRAATERQRGHVWEPEGGYFRLESALNPIPELAPLCHHPHGHGVRRAYLRVAVLPGQQCLHDVVPAGSIPWHDPFGLASGTGRPRTLSRVAHAAPDHVDADRLHPPRTVRPGSFQPVTDPVARRNVRATTQANRRRSGRWGRF